MSDTPIAKGRVKGVEEITIKPAHGRSDFKTVIATTLLIEPLEVSDDPRLNCHGTITVPMQLPFGKKYVLVLRDDDGVPPAPQGRQFKDEE